jgi:polar amino acid transport system substrate-binding protein
MNIRRLICSLFSFSILFCSTVNAQNNTDVQLCYEDQDYPPYLIGTGRKPVMPNPGVLVELTKSAFESAGFTVSYIRRPWKRCMRMVEENKVIGMFGVIYLPEREIFGHYPMRNNAPDKERRLLSVDYPVFVNVDAPVKWDGHTFADKKIHLGTPLGYATVTELENVHHLSPNQSYLPQDGLEAVSLNKLDGYIVERNVGEQLLLKHKLQKTVIAQEPPFKSHDLYLLLSHGFYEKNTEKAEKIWSHLAVLRKTVLDDLMKSYLKR